MHNFPQQPRPPVTVSRIITHLFRAGFRAFFAGGAVRDLLLGVPPVDYDIVTDCPMETLKTLFQKENVKTAGTTFPVLLVNGVEVAPTRGTAGDDFPRDDLGKRDITINSMALHPENGDLLDFHGGRKDLENKCIRFTGTPEKRIAEDPVRMVRACRFLAAVNGTFHHETRRAIIRMAGKMETAAPERLRLEIMKAVTLKRPSLFFNALSDTNLLQRIFPSLARCVDLDGGPHHGETVFEHCMMTGDALPARDPLLRLAGFLHDAGKFNAAHMEEKGLTFKGHETMGHDVIKDLEALRFSNREVSFAAAVIRVHMRPLTEETSPRAVRRLLAFLAANDISPQTFMRMRIADKKANRAKRPYTISEIKHRLGKIKTALATNGHRAFTRNSLALDGNDVMALLHCRPGPKIGLLLDHLFEYVLEDPSLNTREKLTELLLTTTPEIRPGGETAL